MRQMGGLPGVVRAVKPAAYKAGAGVCTIAADALGTADAVQRMGSFIKGKEVKDDGLLRTGYRVCLEASDVFHGLATKAADLR